ncbi:ankyrin repeat domain-containing protein [Pseudomonas rubra]|uniref:Ankyrin repeat domain-containing protein n=1 Tax=Pseudomonas rubra TaxID=2942627 RepID=A0ABT5P984_9PSED|nr:ankyrin repeat domain-containing protein [Pseudomonas rubra]MDD1014767.1 ankyrin repeat domain-containing protein [Pseudomonas rubra]MDD1040784.1 ankyrin repeat domain-containing protein [Pseudomonas rubra]MDD1157686.1 ankyrin repeat domain-containing protein [Pseudomonas rubra]
MELSPAERQLMQAHKLALFEGCVIFDSQPPIDPATLARLEAHLAGPVPQGLLQLWQTCLGGRVGYDLQVDYDGHRHPFSFSELFYPDSDGYHDLWGWIEHERVQAEQAAVEQGREWSGKLDYLPFGGFEYLERLYVCVTPGPDHGAVIAWSRGLPPAWTGSLHHDSLARLADDVGALFRELVYEEDPFDPEAEYSSAGELLEALDELDTAGEAGTALKARLEALLRQRILDWRPALADGSLAAQPRLRQLAMLDAAEQGDIPRLHALRQAGCDLAETLRGHNTSLECCLQRGHLEAADWLLDQGVPVQVDTLQIGAAQVTPALALRLLDKGAHSDPNAVLSAAAQGHLQSAEVMAKPLLEASQSSAQALHQALLERTEQLRRDAKRVKAGKLFSNLSAADYLAEAERIDTLSRRLLR